MAYEDYLKKMSKYIYVSNLLIRLTFVPIRRILTRFEWPIRNGEWGDHVTLQAAADSVCFLNFMTFSFFV